MNFLKKTSPLARLFLSACFLIACEKKEAIPEVVPSGEIYSFREPHMGTTVTIRVWVPATGGEETVENCGILARQAFDRIAELNLIFSDYLVESELSKLSKAPANQAIPVSDELLDILLRAREVHEASDGAFDITIGPMIRLWRRSRKDHKLPSEIQIANAKARIGFDKLKIDPETKTVTKSIETLVFDLGGIAKGYAADEALKILQKGGFRNSLVAASGDIALGESPPGKEGWSVGIDTLEMAEPGENSFFLTNAAVSTSGDTQRFVVIDGRRYSHIVDKETGFGLTDRIAVTVIAPHATMSDSYATAVSLLGREKGMQLIEKLPALECRIVMVDDSGKVAKYFSKGYPAKDVNR